MNTTTFLPLLRGLKAPRDSDAGQLAWRKFAELYGERIYQWAYQSGRSFKVANPEIVAEEIRQDIVAEIHSKMNSYDPARRVNKGGFRRWLRQVTHHALASALNRQPKDRGTGNPDVWQALLNVQAQDDLDRVLTRELEADLVSEAWPAWWAGLNDREKVICQEMGLPDARGAKASGEAGAPPKGQELARRLGMTPANVFKTKQRALDKLRRMVAELRAEYDLDEDAS